MKRSEIHSKLGHYSHEVSTGNFDHSLHQEICSFFEKVFGPTSSELAFVKKMHAGGAGSQDVYLSRDYARRKELLSAYLLRAKETINQKGAFKPKKENILSNKSNLALFLYGAMTFFVGIVVGSKLKPQIVELLEKIVEIVK